MDFMVGVYDFRDETSTILVLNFSKNDFTRDKGRDFLRNLSFTIFENILIDTSLILKSLLYVPMHVSFLFKIKTFIKTRKNRLFIFRDNSLGVKPLNVQNDRFVHFIFIEFYYLFSVI